MKTIDEIAQEHVESVKAYNPTLTWDLVRTAVCYGAQIGAQMAEKELMGRIAYECAIEPTMDGNQVSLLIGDNLQEGVCGFGDTEIDALVALLKDVKEHFAKAGGVRTIRVCRVENEAEQKGLWRKFDGTWEPLFNMLTDGQCKDLPMEDDPIYREGGKRWFASAPSRETLRKWFSKRDLEELTAKGFTISEFEVSGCKKVSDFEYIFTRDNIVSRAYLKVSDIYPE